MGSYGSRTIAWPARSSSGPPWSSSSPTSCASLNNELIPLGQRVAAEIAARARGAESDDAAAIAVESALTLELYSCCRSTTAATRDFLARLYGRNTTHAGPLELEEALGEVQGLLSRVLEDLRTRREAA